MLKKREVILTMPFGRGRKLFGLRPLPLLRFVVCSVKGFTHLGIFERVNFSVLKKSNYEKNFYIVEKLFVTGCFPLDFRAFLRGF